jgi:hypothetical protein
MMDIIDLNLIVNILKKYFKHVCAARAFILIKYKLINKPSYAS